MKTAVVRIAPPDTSFAEDKDYAREVRTAQLLPALERGDAVVLDFQGVRFATQSFVHALIGEALKRFGEAALDRIEFRSCSEQLRSIVDLVVDYSLGGFSSSEPSGATQGGGQEPR